MVYMEAEEEFERGLLSLLGSSKNQASLFPRAASVVFATRIDYAAPDADDEKTPEMQGCQSRPKSGRDICNGPMRPGLMQPNSPDDVWRMFFCGQVR